MSSTDNVDKPGDSQAPTEGVIIQLLPDASLNQSDSPSAPERNEIAEAVEDLDSGGNSKKRKTASLCQICQANIKNEKPYYQRYRICPTCSSIDRMDELDGLLKRFCQQCGKFQSLQLFDGTMRTCRERLDRHAARRRKSHARQAAMRRGSPVDDSEPASPQVAYSPPFTGMPQHHQQQQYFQPPHHVHQQQRQQPQPSLSLSQPMLDLAQHLLHRVHPQQRSFTEQQRAIQHQQQQQHMTENLMATIAATRPAPANLLNPLYQPTPLRFSPSPHAANHHLGQAAVNPTAAAGKLEAVLALLLNEAAAVAPPPAPPPPPPAQNDNDALQIMLQRLVALASAAANGAGGAGGGGGNGVSIAPSVPSAAAPVAASHPAPVVAVPVSNINPVFAAVNGTNTTAAPPAANKNDTATATGNEHADGSSSSFPAALAGMAPQLQAALAAFLKHQQEEKERASPQN